MREATASQTQTTANHTDQRLSCENTGRVVGNPTWGSLNLCKDLSSSQHAKISPTPSAHDWTARGASCVLAWNVLSDRRPCASTHPGPAISEHEHNMDNSLVKKAGHTRSNSSFVCVLSFTCPTFSTTNPAFFFCWRDTERSFMCDCVNNSSIQLSEDYVIEHAIY